MASFPCEGCGKMFRGSATYVYPAVYAGLSVRRRRVRLCPLDGLAVLGAAREFLMEGTEPYEFAEDTQCPFCHKSVGMSTSVLFLTAYESDDRVDFCARVCEVCAKDDGLLLPGLTHRQSGERSGPTELPR